MDVEVYDWARVQEMAVGRLAMATTVQSESPV